MIEIYNESMELVSKPDLTLGYLKAGTRVVHHDAVRGIPEEWHYETVAEYKNGGKDIRKVVDVPGVKDEPAWDEEIPIVIYTMYTAEELEELDAKRKKPSIEARVETVEGETAELREALDLILSGVTE